MLTYGSLFTGIGGIDLGLDRAGLECRWQVEIDPYCQTVLKEHWPNVPKFGDIRELGEIDLEPVDLIAGGFPCQPFSNAGKRRGVDDERWLWPEFARIVRLLRPRYVLVENVPGLLAGRGMAEVLGDLAALGFDAEWECIPAAAVSAPHLRWRVFVVAYSVGKSVRVQAGSLGSAPGAREGEGTQRQRLRPDIGAGGAGAGDVADADGRRLEGIGSSGLLDGERPALGNDVDGRHSAVADTERNGSQGIVAARPATGAAVRGGALAAAEEFAERSGLREAEPGGFRWGRLGNSDWWAVEPDVGRVANGVPSRVDRLRSLGNAVVPQVAEAIGRMIVEFDQ